MITLTYLRYKGSDIQAGRNISLCSVVLNCGRQKKTYVFFYFQNIKILSDLLLSVFFVTVGDIIFN